jgi:hypothetical protein
MAEASDTWLTVGANFAHLHFNIIADRKMVLKASDEYEDHPYAIDPI